MIEVGAGLYTDLYQLTMAIGYLKKGIADTPVVCEAFVRRLPKRRSFLVVAGLGLIVEYLKDLSFTKQQLDYLRTVPSIGEALDDTIYQRLLTFRLRERNNHCVS